MAKKKLRMHTHAQYVALRDNEDRLIGERFTALLFASSFLAVVWGTADSIGVWGRLGVAALGLVITLLIWRMNYRGAEAAQDWRRHAIALERRLYGRHPRNKRFSKGPYGLRMVEDGERRHSTIERAWRLLRWPGLGGTNALSAFYVPLTLVCWWIFAILYSFSHDW